MRKIYFITLIVVSVLVMVFAIPGVALVAVVLTFGFAALLLGPLPYLLLVLWAVFPAVLSWKVPVLRYAFLAAGAVLVAAVQVAPPRLADAAFARDLASRNDMTARARDLGPPTGIEIHRQVDPHPDLTVPGRDTGAFFGTQPCFELCERLLAGGDIAWIRVVMTDDAFGNYGQRTHALLVPGTPGACQEVNPDFSTGEGCVLFAPDHGVPADLLIVLDERATGTRDTDQAFYMPTGYRTVVGFAGPDTEAPVLFRKTQLFHRRPTGEFSYDFGSLGRTDTGGGFQFMRIKAASAAIDLAETVQGLGLALGPVRRPQHDSANINKHALAARVADAQETAYVASLLATGPEWNDRFANQFSNAFGQIVNDWHRLLPASTSRSETERAVLCATRIDTRIQHLSWQKRLSPEQAMTCR